MGAIKSSKLLLGMHVKCGETIAIMEDQQLYTVTAGLFNRQSQTELCAKDFERQRDLNASKAWLVIRSSAVYFQADYESQKNHGGVLWRKTVAD